MLNLQLKLGAFGQNAQGFEKDYRGEPEPPARGQGSVLPEIKNYGAGGEFIRERLEGTNKEGLGISRYEFIRNQQRIEYPSVLFPQAPLAFAKEQIKQIAKMLMKDYAEIRNSYLPDSAKQDMITEALLKVKDYPAPLVRVADELVEARLSEFDPMEEIDPNDYDFIDDLEEYLAQQEAPRMRQIILSGSGSATDPLVGEMVEDLVRREMVEGTFARIDQMRGEGGDLEDIVAGDDSAPLKVAMPAPQSMDALGTHRGQPIREERRTYRELLRNLPNTISQESLNALSRTEKSNLRKEYRAYGVEIPMELMPTRGSKFGTTATLPQRITGGALPRETSEATASATSSVPAPMTREELRRATQQD